MAGISLISTINRRLSPSKKISEALDSLNYMENYKSRVIKDEGNIFIGYNTYDEYPVRTYDTAEFLIIIEGRVYNKSESALKADLEKFAVFLTPAILSDWVTNADGDFIIYILNKAKKTLYIFNDVLGRLPIYYRNEEDCLYLSRYIKFILDTSGKFSFDRTGFGEYLLLGYLLGKRTLYDGVKQLRPASLITVNENSIKVETCHDFNFDNRIHKNKKLEENISNLSELFSDGCRNRFSDGKTNVLSMSGGLDSRTIAACMAKNKIPFEAVTMVYQNKHEEGEAEIAKLVADFLGIKLRTVTMIPPTGTDMLNLIKIKEGMIYLSTAPMLPYYRELNAIYSRNINMIFGEKSDKITLVFDNPTKKINSLEQLAQYIVGEHSFMDFKEVCSRLNLQEDDILNDFYNLLRSYPENDYTERYVHFRAIEKSHKLAYQGDDRNKRYFWSFSPLTSSPFVTYLFNIPNKQKKMHRIFIGLLNSYYPGLADIIYPNFKAPITSIKAKLFMSSVYYLYPRLPHKINKNLKNLFFGANIFINKNSTYYKFIKEQINNTREIIDFIDVSDLLNLADIRSHSLHSLITLTSLVEYMNFHKSTFNNFANEEFNYRD